MSVLLLLPALLIAGVPSRVGSLEDSLLAPCCYTEPIARHRSEIAFQMKREIRDWVAQGKTDREILDAYKIRYGAKVLVEPEGATWWWVHVIPWIALALGALIAIHVLRRLRARPAPQSAPATVPNAPDWDDF
jgi:cytochrome c-type biogenesis protein CcmH